MNKLMLGLFSILLVGLLIVGCSEKPVDPVSNVDLVKIANFMLPPGATLESANFYIYVVGESGRNVEVKRITNSWDEPTVTWNTFGGAFAPDVYGSFVASSIGWHSVDLTALVQEWLDGTYENYGFLLDQEEITYPRSIFPSRESDIDKPYMEICYSIGGVPYCENINPLADAFINQYYADLQHGLLTVLFTGWAADNGYEKQSMLMFEFTPSPPELASLGDKVWFDNNENGIQDGGEPGAEGVTVYLYNCDDELLATTVTDANGNYLFSDLPAGNYYVVFDLPSGYSFSPQDQGADDAVDSDADLSGKTICTNLEAGEDDMTWDAGIFFPDEECGECKGKITELTFQYLGAASANIEVVTKKEGTTIFSGVVDPDGLFTFIGDDRHGTMGTEISVYVDGVLNVKIHTSCSQPLEIGMVFGDFEVIDGYSREGGKICVYDGPGDDPDCGTCEGKITELTLRYLGDSSADIEVKAKKKKHSSSVLFSGSVDADATFNFVGNDKKGTMGTEIKIYVDGELNVKIHTSCSQEIEIGMIFGDFEIVDGYSRNGGQICTYE